MGAVIWTVVFPAILLVAGVVLLVLRRKISDGLDVDRTWGTTLLASVAIATGVMIFVLNTFTVVPPRNVAVVVEFGKADQALSSGPHWVPPWSSIEKVDGTVQTQLMTVKVRLANQTTADVDAVVQWNVSQEAHANELWQRYRGKDDNVIKNIHDNVIWRQTTVALNEVFADYNPLVVLSGGKEDRSQQDLAAQALGILKSNVDPGIQVDVLAISLIHYDEVTQSKLNGYAQALADTQIATQQKLTAEQQKLANDKLAVSSSNNPGVKYQNCLNFLKDLAAKGQLAGLPVTFNCGEPNGGPGNSGGVIVNSAR